MSDKQEPSEYSQEALKELLYEGTKSVKWSKGSGFYMNATEAMLEKLEEVQAQLAQAQQERDEARKRVAELEEKILRQEVLIANMDPELAKEPDLYMDDDGEEITSFKDAAETIGFDKEDEGQPTPQEAGGNP